MSDRCKLGYAQMSQEVELLELKESEPDADGMVLFRGRISAPSFIPLQRGDECRITLPDGRSGLVKIKDRGVGDLTFYGAFS